MAKKTCAECNAPAEFKVTLTDLGGKVVDEDFLCLTDAQSMGFANIGTNDEDEDEDEDDEDDDDDEPDEE